MKKTRVGESYYNKSGERMEIINYRNSLDCDVQFEDGYISKNIQYDRVKKGIVKNKNSCKMFKVGYNYYDENGNKQNELSFNVWVSMLSRCYSSDKKAYEKVFVCKEWHNYNNFKMWFDDNFINENFIVLDKDIKTKNNIEYSPYNCSLVSQEINNLFVRAEWRGGKFLRGVSYDNNKRRFVASCNVNGVCKRLKRTKTEHEAFLIYKSFKENHIKEIENKYKDFLSESCYMAMLSYKVEKTD